MMAANAQKHSSTYLRTPMPLDNTLSQYITPAMTP